MNHIEGKAYVSKPLENVILQDITPPHCKY